MLSHTDHYPTHLLPQPSLKTDTSKLLKCYFHFNTLLNPLNTRSCCVGKKIYTGWLWSWICLNHVLLLTVAGTVKCYAIEELFFNLSSVAGVSWYACSTVLMTGHYLWTEQFILTVMTTCTTLPKTFFHTSHHTTDLTTVSLHQNGSFSSAGSLALDQNYKNFTNVSESWGTDFWFAMNLYSLIDILNRLFSLISQNVSKKIK